MITILRISILFLLFSTLTTLSFAEHIRYLQTSEAGFSYELIIENETSEVMKPLPVRLSITDKDGNKISGAKINCSLMMPAMAMPENKPPLKESDQSGQYKGIFLLTMGGLWHVELAFQCCDGITDDIVIPMPGVSSNGKGSDIDNKLEELFHDSKS